MPVIFAAFNDVNFEGYIQCTCIVLFFFSLLVFFFFNLLES